MPASISPTGSRCWKTCRRPPVPTHPASVCDRAPRPIQPGESLRIGDCQAVFVAGSTFPFPKNVVDSVARLHPNRSRLSGWQPQPDPSLPVPRSAPPSPFRIAATSPTPSPSACRASPNTGCVSPVPHSNWCQTPATKSFSSFSPRATPPPTPATTNSRPPLAPLSAASKCAPLASSRCSRLAASNSA